MIEEKDLAPDYSAIDPGLLEVYPLPPSQTVPSGPGNVNLIVNGVRAYSSIVGEQEPREYSVEVEYTPDDLGLDGDSLGDYLMSYSTAEIEQESMTRKIRRDLIDVLDIDDAFVEVKTTGFVTKRTQIGRPE